MLLVLWRPKLGGYGRPEYGFAVAFGLVLAGMNLSLDLAIDRIPLGVAVTLEFVGPLGVAVLGSRQLLDGALGGARGRRHRPARAAERAGELGPGSRRGVTFALLAGRRPSGTRLHPA